MANQTGTLYSYNVDQTGNSVPAAVGASADLRRIHNFGDRVAELSPEESPFFVYLNKVAKVPTDDSVFRFLENRSKIDWTSRNFFVDGTALTNVVADSSYTITVDDNASSPSKVDWLVKGMIFAVETDRTAQSQVIFRVEGITQNSADTTLTARCISLSKSANDSTEYNDIANDDECQVIGTSFAEGSGSPDVWSSQLDDDFGYCQIFKTAAEMTNTAIATNYRGYANEWDRIWNLKLREHKVDIERAMLFSMRARSDSLQYSEGIVGHILANATAVASGSASYTSGAAYMFSQAAASVTYDSLLSDFEVLYDPARGGNKSKLGLASRPVISYFNKLAGFADTSTALGSGDNYRYNFNASQRDGAFGHSIMQVNTVHGDLSLISEPMFRGIASGYLALVDLDHVAYRPLVGNGLNRDTHIITNVQQADEDLRKDMILTEAGLEITIPETHALYSFTDL
jgi:hypothetical protein